MEWTAVALVAVIALLAHRLLFRRRPNFPPGPVGLPLVGYVPFMRPNRYVAFQRLGEKFGDVFSVPLFTSRFVVLNSIKAIREALLDHADAFSYRGHLPLAEQNHRGKGIITTDGPHWQEHRRFALRTLRDFGFAKTVSLEAVHLEVRELAETLEKHRGRPVSTKIVFSRMTTNVICSIVFGGRLTESDPRCDHILTLIMESIKADESLFESLPNICPWLTKIPLFMPLFNLASVRTKNISAILDFIKEKVEEHSRCIGEMSEPRDFIDALILHRQSLEAQGQAQHTFDIESMVVDVFHLFVAGTDTTSVTLTWGCLLMALYPDVQEKARKEILDQIGPEKLPTMQDRPKFNYTLAVIDEVSRFSSIVPTSLPHRVNADTTVGGHLIPKDAIVFPNIYAVHHDAKLWDYPESFDPRNFMDGDEVYKSSDNLIQFSLGKRSCLGESLARMEVFIFFVAILQRYRLSLVDRESADPEEMLKGNNSVIRYVQDHELLVSPIG